MKITCKWCGKTTTLAGDEPDKLTTCITCLGNIVEAIPKETRNNVTVIGLSGNHELPKC